MSHTIPLPFSGTSPLSRHHSALAADAAATRRGVQTLRYLALLKEVGRRGITDHQAATMLGMPLSSINSIRNGCGDLVEPNPEETGLSPFGRRVTRWRLTQKETA